MKNLFSILIVFICFGTAFSQLSGTKYIGGTSPDYSTIKAAIKDLNTQGVTAPGITFLILDGVYTEDSLRIATNTSNASAPIIFKPDIGATVVINVTPPNTSYNFAIKIEATQYVMLDGSNQNGGSSRDMTINSRGNYGQKGIWVSSASHYATIMNCNINAGKDIASPTNSVIGVDFRYVSGTGNDPDYILCKNNHLKYAYTGIRMTGVSSTDVMESGIIESNIIDSVCSSGVYSHYQNNSIIRNNDINILRGSSSAIYGIYLDSHSDVKVYSNLVHDIKQLSTSNGTYGIYVWSTAGIIYNNIIWAINLPSTGDGGISAFNCSYGSSVILAFNSVYMTGTSGGNRLTYAFFAGSSIGLTDVHNNIFHNVRTDGTSGIAFAIGKLSYTPISSNNNNLYVGNPDAQHQTGRIFYPQGPTNYLTLDDWRNVSSGDTVSFAENTPFISGSDLHIQTTVPTYLESGGIPLAGISTDIDGDTRNSSTPDIGADEFAGIQSTVPIFSVLPLSKDFGFVYTGLSSPSQTFTIINTGTGTLTITSGGISIIGTNNDQFILTDANIYPINLAAGQSATVDVKFVPTSAGIKISELQIVDNITDATHTAQLTGVGVSPPPYFTDFEAFTAGQQVACQDPVNWITWSSFPCDATEDPYISATYAYSGSNSVKIVNENDLVKPFLSLTNGKWSITFMVYIPAGKSGYFNTMALFNGDYSKWAMECHFHSGGYGRLYAGSATYIDFTWVANSWKMVNLIVDLDSDNAEFYYNGVLIKGWQWTLGYNGEGCPLQLDANDFFGEGPFDEMYIDNYSFQPATNTFPLSVDISNGWNMVSVPGINPDGQTVSNWWVNHIGTVYKYVPGSGYNGITNTLSGEGYWMKNNEAQTYNTGDEWPAGGIQFVTHDPVNAVLGWNMFGGYEDIVNTSSLTTNPPDKIVSIYKFVPGTGYQPATQIVPGYGYWLKVSAACTINIPDALAKGNQKVAEFFKDDWGKITLTDAAGSSYTLYAVKGDSPNSGAGVDLNQYELPPLPPSGLFDVRFGSSRVAEDINSDFKSIEMRGITYPVRVKVEGMDIKLMDVTGKLINTNIKDGEEITIDNSSIDKVMVSGQLIPDKYSLEQNYPNPFNPSTTIQFSLPENVKNVKLSVYNILGEKVAELVNGSMQAGKYEFKWNAKNFASGMYIYELRTKKFTAVKKMLLLK